MNFLSYFFLNLPYSKKRLIKIAFIFLSVFAVNIHLAEAQSQSISIVDFGSDFIEFEQISDNENMSFELFRNDQFVAKSDFDFGQNIRYSNLLPGTIYELRSKDDNGILIDVFPFVTKSKSSGEIRIYFNNNTDENFSNGMVADGESADVMEDAIIDLIDAAQHTLSICTYNTNRENIVDALRRAYDRGVEVRLITDVDRNNFGLQSNIPFPILRGAIGDGIMHNKFIITDAEFDDLAWVQTGSVNYTDFQMTEDPNHAIMIQDKALAQVYLIEFNEMWGSSSLTPNLVNSKFGDKKSDNTPHFLNINGIEVESYFSPSDNTDSFIMDRIDAAQEEINVAMLIFTRWELRDAIIAAHNRGVTIKMIIEDEENSRDNLDRFDQAGLTTYYIDDNPTLMHHKYAIIDEGSASAQAYLITGSQNWTYSGNRFNDENTLIFKDADIANIFRQEFQNLWKGISTNTENTIKASVEFVAIINHGELLISSSVPYQSVLVSSISGQQLSLYKNIELINVSHLPPGIYVVTINQAGVYQSKKVYID